VVELVLAEEDFEIKSVSNGEDALNILESFRPDIVLADIEMPKVNGYQLCDRIKKNPAVSHVPVILLAGAFEPIDEDLAREVGADDSVIKPFESQELISKINASLTMSSSAAEEVAEVEGIEAEAVGEEVFELAEEAAEAVEAGEAAGVAGAEEDLWSMEEVPEIVEEGGAGAVPEEEGLEETFEISEEAASPEAALAAPAEEAERPASRAAGAALMPEAAVLSRDEMMAAFEKTVKESVSSFLSSLDIRDVLLASLAPAMKESAEKVLWEIAPELAEKMLKEILKGSLASLTSEVEKVIWETVPDLASSMISKEIEKIKSDF
jgi:CheY-like chemotaxis protein